MSQGDFEYKVVVVLQQGPAQENKICEKQRR